METYYSRNREARLKYQREYRKRNNIKFKCVCGGHYYKPDKVIHENTALHKDFMKQFECKSDQKVYIYTIPL